MDMNNEQEYKNDSKSILLMVLGIAILVVAVIGVSFAAFSATKTNNKINTLTTGAISMAFNDTTYIDMKNAMPMKDRDGIALTGDYNSMKFTVSANVSGSTTIAYTLSAVDVTTADGKKLPENYVKVYLTKENTAVLNPTLYSDLKTVDFDGQKGKELTQGSFTTSSSSAQTYVDSYELKMWVDENAVIGSEPMTFKIKVRLDAKQQ